MITHWHSALAVPVHPRGRGKHDCRYSNHDLLYGSSPRARETYPANSVVFQANRFIPAGAGNMGISKKLPFTVSVHPRGRGKHEHHSGLFAPVIGSSPRARETCICPLLTDNFPRFIPAGAGNIQISCNSRFALTVHPRGRGKHSAFVASVQNDDGSSPRARET